MNILLTGGGGFIGKNLNAAWQETHCVEAPNRQALELTDTEAVNAYFENKSFDAIVHGANVGGTRKDPQDASQDFYQNIRGFSNLYHQKQAYRTFIQLGSGAEYGRPLQSAHIREEALEHAVPNDVYGLAKRTCSRILENTQDVRAVTLHLFGVFGPHEDYQLRFISNAIVRSLMNLPIVMNQDVLFDYLYVDDLARVIEWLVDNPGEHDHYNVTAGTPMKLSEIAEVVKSVTQNPHPIQIKQTGLGNAYTGSNERLKDYLPCDFKFTSIESGIKLLSSWYASMLTSLDQERIANPL